MMKKIIAPPLLPTAIYVGLCLFTYISSRMSLEIINGVPDNAPYRASIILLALTPFAYLLFVVINSIDLLIERATKRLPWFSILVPPLVFSGLLFVLFYRPELDGASSLALIALVSLLGAPILIVPMGFLRRRIEKKTKAEQGGPGYPPQGVGSPDP